MLSKELLEQINATKLASRKLAQLTTELKNKFLLSLAEAILQNQKEVLSANKIDIDFARQTKLSSALIDRLILTPERIKNISDSLYEIAKLSDPVNEIVAEWTAPSGIHIQKIRVPIGVILVIYESRPNVTIDAIALCIKSGNAVILRGGKEAINTNFCLVNITKNVLKTCGIVPQAVEFISSAERETVYGLLKLYNLIDLVIPRGSEEMIKSIREHSIIPVISHGKGLCHTYIDKSASVEQAIKIAYNAKVQRPGVCNAMETLLVHNDIAEKILPQLGELYKEANVELRGCERTRKILPWAKIASEQDWFTEYLDLILSVKVVNSLEEAIEHINRYGSGHSEAIVTEDTLSGEKFLKEVDASAVFLNASTRLHDGGVFGLGAEIGISTQKLHARGTMGLKELTTTKYIVRGKGHIRQ